MFIYIKFYSSDYTFENPRRFVSITSSVVVISKYDLEQKMVLTKLTFVKRC